MAEPAGRRSIEHSRPRQPAPAAIADLPDGCLTAVLEHLDVSGLLAARSSSKRLKELVQQQSVWRTRLQQDFPHHFGRLKQRSQLPSLNAYKRRHGIQRRWQAGTAASTEFRIHTGPVFAVTNLEDPHILNGASTIITGGVFGYGEVAELFQWNSRVEALPLEWPDCGQLGGVLELSQRCGYPQLIVGGFSGCAQILALEERNAATMEQSEVHAMCAGALPPSWLGVPHEELVARLEAYGPLLTATHTHTLRGHSGAVPAIGSSAAAARGGTGMVATCGFDGATLLWHPSEGERQDNGSGRAVPAIEEPVAVLRDEADGGAAAAAPEQGGAPVVSLASESQSVCSVVVRPDGTSLATGCNDRLVRIWDVEKRAVTRRLRGHEGWVWCLEPHPDQPQALLSGATDGSVRMWDLRCPDAEAQTRLLQIADANASVPNQGAVAGIAVRPDGRALVAGCFDTRLSVIDLRSWSVSAILEGHSHRITRVAATDDAIFSASFDSSVRHWTFE